ncbi:hypothetical protein [Scytonema sp. NUACC26]|uniref:phosphoribosyltransferase-like protein n=1 Tax=Scytonema sp. NUACC26 TaxID=3140176 RepID=UPI0034DB7E5C
MQENTNSSNHQAIKHFRIINDDIKFCQRKLSDLISPYNKPLASILPEERQVEQTLLFDEGIDIDEHYDRLRGWEGSISKIKIRNWLNQFDTPLEKNIAHLLLSKIQFFSSDKIEIATRRLQEKLLQFLMEEDRLRQAFFSVSKPAVKNEAEFQKWLRNKIIRYAMLPSPTDTSVESQHRLWSIYERSALTTTSSQGEKKFKLLKEYFEARKGEPENSVFVFMDYTNGSGNQLTKCIREINKLLAEYPAYQNSFFVFMYVVQSKSFSLDSIEFAPSRSDTLFYEEMLDYKNSEIIELLTSYRISTDEYDAFIEKYCLRASGKLSAGYRESGALTCHHYSCPNNTLPFFHKSSQNWEPLFRTSQTPSATRYKQGQK